MQNVQSLTIPKRNVILDHPGHRRGHRVEHEDSGVTELLLVYARVDHQLD